MVIPVLIPRHAGVVEAIVDKEDYDKVMGVSPRWRLSHNGYAIFVVKRFGRLTTFYMHKIIHGQSARHINGDRLDNRKTNLVTSHRQETRSELVMNGSDFQYELKYDDNYIKQFGPETWISVQYADGKRYQGYTHQGIPEGYGTLSNPRDRTEVCGYWSKGVIVDGMISRYRHKGELRAIDLVKRGVVVL